MVTEETIITIINEPSMTDIILMVATFSAVGAALLGVWLTNKRTKESNEELKKSNNLVLLELKHKFEPNLGVSNPNIQYETDKITANFTCDVINKGKIILHEFTVYTTVVNKKPSAKSIIEKENEIKTENNLSNDVEAFPPDLQMSDFKVTFKEPNHENIFVILWCEFEILSEKQENIIFLTFKNLQYVGYDVIPYSKIKQIRT